MKWIRWSGLAGFAAVVALLAAIWLLLAPWLIRASIETLGSKVARARVDVQSVSMMFSPIGVEIRGLTVANASQPMENLFEVDRAEASLEVGPLFLGKTIIQELSINGLEFNTARTVSGALPQSASASSASDGSAGSKEDSGLASQLLAELPSAEEILERESLQTDAAGKTLVSTFDTRKQQVNSAVAALPDEKALLAYQDEVQALTANNITSLQDFQQRKQKLDELRARFKADKKAITSARDLIGETRIDLTDKLKTLRDAPAADLASIRAKYQLNAEGAVNLSGLLFGDDVGNRAAWLLHWYQELSPWLDKMNSTDGVEEPEVPRPEGRFVHFPSADPWPDFLIRKAHINATTSVGKLEGEAIDITGQQRLIGRPMQFTAEGVDMPSAKSLNLKLVLDHRQKPATDSFTLTSSDWQMPAVELGIGETRLDAAKAQVQASASVSAGELSSKLDMQMASASFSGSGQTLFAKELTSALQTVKEFNIRAAANGELPSPKVELGSDLDRRLSAAFTQRLRVKQDELEARLQKKINERIDQYAGSYADDLKAINDMDGSLADRFAKLEELAKAELKEYADQKKQEAKDKAKTAVGEQIKKIL